MHAILGGELVVTVGDATGCGGRNQEFVLAARAASPAAPTSPLPQSIRKAPTARRRRRAASWTARRSPGRRRPVGHRGGAGEPQLERRAGRPHDLIVTGVRGTNVRDLRLIYVGGAAL